ncbi:MAG TPA: ribonuclease E activity regulator RraA [Thermobifida alba]|nr:ribonuclease E activity regulator RraA [Thermobifida alba]
MSETFTTADLIDAHGDELASCETQFRQFGGVRTFFGRIRTVKCHEDNALVKEVLNQPGEGRVLVVDGGGSLRSALMGDMIAAAAERNGWAGVVINGAVRDVAELAALSLGVKALGSNPRKSAKAGAGVVDGPVAFGQVVFTPGAWLYSDEDGIVVSDRELPLG